MPRMTKSWRRVAWTLAILGFIAVAVRALPHSEFIPGATGCPAAAFAGGCFREVPGDASALVLAAVSAVLCYGLLYVVFLVVRRL